ncbi:MFS transporter [Enemella sp. A6]|uniref:MFS transporter n=1 Tax=Enemella sp. A6 TaxID=3440152 RepID=UPI003EB8312F
MAGPKNNLRFLIATYLPTTLATIGVGGILPLIPLTARQLGGSLEMAAFITALMGIGQLVGDLPAGVIAAKIGEKRALLAAAVLDAAALLTAWQAKNLFMLGAAVFVVGLATAVVGLARLSYLTVAVPPNWRARALSTLGGVFRIGFFVGPLIAAGIVAVWGMTPAYLLAAVMSITAGLVTLALPDLPADPTPAGTTPPKVGLWSVLHEHRRVLATLGVGALSLMLVRSARQAILPLWSDHVGLDPAVSTLLFGISMGVDMTLFYFGGAIMDRFGRRYVVLPSMVIMGVGLLVLPLATTAFTIGLVGALLGLGNGISSGVVMTMGSDASPAVGRTQFLAGWRLMADAGNAGGPLVISAVTVAFPLFVASLVVGVLSFLGGGWLRHFLPRRNPE